MSGASSQSLRVAHAAPALADRQATIAKVRASVVAVGTFDRTRSPQFQFLGTGFIVADGTLVVTNSHVLPAVLDPVRRETIAILLPGRAGDKDKDDVQAREARQIAVDPSTDLALLKINGAPLPALAVRDSEGIREGQEVLFTGFPIGAVLGPFPATHHGMVSVITPIAIPQGRAAELDSAVVRRLASGAFPVFGGGLRIGRAASSPSRGVNFSTGLQMWRWPRGSCRARSRWKWS